MYLCVCACTHPDVVCTDGPLCDTRSSLAGMSCMDLQPLPFPTRTCAVQEPPSALSTHKLQRRGSSETHPFQTPLPAPPSTPAKLRTWTSRTTLKTPGSGGWHACLDSNCGDERAAVWSLDRRTGTRGANWPGITETVLLRSMPAPFAAHKLHGSLRNKLFPHFHQHTSLLTLLNSLEKRIIQNKSSGIPEISGHTLRRGHKGTASVQDGEAASSSDVPGPEVPQVSLVMEGSGHIHTWEKGRLAFNMSRETLTTHPMGVRHC